MVSSLSANRGGRRKLRAAYEWMYQVSPVPHREVVEFVRQRNLHGRGVGWIFRYCWENEIMDSRQGSLRAGKGT
jgi:hypothetical protein